MVNFVSILEAPTLAFHDFMFCFSSLYLFISALILSPNFLLSLPTNGPALL